ncbi:MAG: hypothetical protein V2A79_09800 [Planctomycetota bacterium]
MMDSQTYWKMSLVLLLITVMYWCLAGLAAWLVYRFSSRLLAGLEKAQRDQSVIVSELLAHRTLAETGNQAIAAQILAHSNAHGARTEVPVVWTPEPARADLQAHPGNAAVEIGVDEDVDLPRPEET